MVTNFIIRPVGLKNEIESGYFKNRSKTGKYQRNIKLFEDKSSVNILNKVVNLIYLLEIN